MNQLQATQHCSFLDESSARDGEYENYAVTASGPNSCCPFFDDPSFSWDPIVNPEHFGSLKAWLPDGYSRIFRIVCVWPFGLLDYGSATLRCKI